MEPENRKVKNGINNDYYYYYLILELKFVNFDCFYNITLCVKYMIDLFSLIKKACI